MAARRQGPIIISWTDIERPGATAEVQTTVGLSLNSSVSHCKLTKSNMGYVTSHYEVARASKASAYFVLTAQTKRDQPFCAGKYSTATAHTCPLAPRDLDPSPLRARRKSQQHQNLLEEKVSNEPKILAWNRGERALASACEGGCDTVGQREG